MAPIYDSGSSLGYDKLPGQIRSGRDVTCKPFKNHHEEQLKLVTSFDGIDFEKLVDVKELIRETLSDSDAADHMDEVRIKAILDSVEKRIQHLQEIAMTRVPALEISTRDDVEKNIAEDYS